MTFSELSLDTLLQSDPDALYEQAVRWRHGDGLGSDLFSARRVFGFLSLSAHSAARYQLGVMNLRGEGGAKNPIRALMWFRLAHGRDEPRAASQIKMLSEELTAIDARRALKMVAEAEKCVRLFFLARDIESDQSIQAMASLGANVLHGIGAERDEILALEWLHRAAHKHHPDAQLHLGLAYAHGQGVRKNLSEALRLLHLASEQHHHEASYQWAQLLEQHPKQIHSSNQVRHLYESAAKHGHALAQQRLGYLLRGDWTPPPQELPSERLASAHKKTFFKRHNDPDLVSALRYFTMAAEQRLADAQFEVGQMYAQGLGTQQLFDQALYWYELAARQGHAKAQFNIGFLYAYGQGVNQSYTKAYEWYRISHLCAYPLAKKPMEFTAKKLSVGEIEMADWRVDSFIYNLPQNDES